MSSPFDEREEYLKNPFLKREYGDFTSFYVTVAICTIFGVFLLVLNITLCCSRYKDYWCDSNTGKEFKILISNAHMCVYITHILISLLVKSYT